MHTNSQESDSVTVIPSIHAMDGVDTLEGKIGPIFSATKGSAHYITMHPDLYCPAHPHSTESIIYTAKGTWVLYANQTRYIMPEGSIFHMPAHVDTGYEVPYDEPATLLITKFEGPINPGEFISYLNGLAERLLKDEQDGAPYSLSALSSDHPARRYANQINPEKYP